MFLDMADMVLFGFSPVWSRCSEILSDKWSVGWANPWVHVQSESWVLQGDFLSVPRRSVSPLFPTKHDS